MKIKVAVLDDDQNYLKKMGSCFTSLFSDKIEMYSFSDMEAAFKGINEGPKKIDIFLANQNFDIDTDRIPPNCGFAYLVDTIGIDNYKNQKTICKFQKIELIYKQMLDIYADVADVVISAGQSDGNDALVLSFVSAGGGDGSSSVAAGCAKYLAGVGKKVLYLNLEQFGSSSVFFEADGTSDLSDIILAIRNNKANLTLKLESFVKHDVSGVYFFESCKMAFDVMEINPNDMQRLLHELKALGKYDYIIIDMDFNFNDREVEVMKESYRIVFVNSGMEISNLKLKKVLDAIAIFEQENRINIIPKINMIYNKFDSRASKLLSLPEIEELGGIKIFDEKDTKQVVQNISENKIFENFIVE